MVSELKIIRDILLTITSQVYHYTADTDEDTYFVWSEDGENNSLFADNKRRYQNLTGTIDLFTKTEYDPYIDVLQNKLESSNITYSLNSVQYEDETKYIHYEWVFEVN